MVDILLGLGLCLHEVLAPGNRGSRSSTLARTDDGQLRPNRKFDAISASSDAGSLQISSAVPTRPRR